ncbi:MAG: hypothetical protein RBQ97_07900 [Acholeplasma sp.]|nr:hypothetical protein [Acholeplasma sp.]
MKKYRTIIILIITMLLTAITSISAVFAYWDFKESHTNDCELGVGTDLYIHSSSDTDNANKKLMPIGSTISGNEVTELLYEYSVSLYEQHADDIALSIELDLSNSHSLLNFEITWKYVFDNEFVIYNPLAKPLLINNSVNKIINVLITVTLNYPTTNDEYNEIVNMNIDFQTIFKASIKN